jgi:hypothetical protein
MATTTSIIVQKCSIAGRGEHTLPIHMPEPKSKKFHGKKEGE